MKFKIIPPTMPSLEEHRAASARWLQRIKPCLYENWPDALMAMSFRTKLVEVSRDDLTAMLDMFDGKGPSAAPGLAEKIDRQMVGFQHGTFAKLSSRSPKDAWCETFKCHSGNDVLSLFASSARILDDLIEYKYLDDPCYILLREWQNIPKHEEWRCFVRGGKIIGITQYHYTDDFREIYGDGEEIHTRIRQYLDEEVIPSLHADPLVVDVWLRQNPMVIEINPYGASDPCLLTYSDLKNGDCGFRTFVPESARPAIAAS